MSKITKIILHCSDSTHGCVNDIREWHKAKGWRDIGYHFVICNGYIDPDFYLAPLNGSIECGRVFDGDLVLFGKEIGAHALGYNQSSIGICLIGEKEFTQEQYHSVYRLIRSLMKKFSIHVSNVIGHYETEQAHGKTCPNIDMADFRENVGLEKHWKKYYNERLNAIGD